MKTLKYSPNKIKYHWVTSAQSLPVSLFLSHSFNTKKKKKKKEMMNSLCPAWVLVGSGQLFAQQIIIK